MKMRFLMEWQTLKSKVKQYSQETQNRNIKNWPQGLAAAVWKPSNKLGNSTGLQYTLIRLCGLPEVTQGFSKSKTWCKSAWVGTNQAAFLMLALFTLSLLSTWLPSLLFSRTHCASPQDYKMHCKALLEKGTFLISVISTLRCKPKPIWVNTALKNKSGMLGKSMIFKN